MARFDLATVWRLRSPLADVWDAISHADAWPSWWRGLVRVVELEPGDGSGVGSLRRFCWRGAIPYPLTFEIRTTRVETSRLIEGAASGDVRGIGVWSFRREEGETVVRHDWRVRTDTPWMDLLGGIAAPLMRWNHARVMDWGRRGLERHLATGPENGCCGR